MCVIALALLVQVRPYKLASDYYLAAASHLALVFLFICAILVSEWQEIAATKEIGAEAAEAILGFDDDRSIVDWMLVLTFGLIPLFLAVIAYQVHCERQRAKLDAQFSACTVQVPTFDWRPTKRFAAFLSHFKIECAADARFLHDTLAKMLRSPMYLDSSALVDLRELFNDGLLKSDVLVLLASANVLTRPWCMLELLVAKRTGIPIVLLQMTNSQVDVQAMREFVNQLRSKLNAMNRLDLVLGYVEDLSELQAVLNEIIDMLEAKGQDLPKWSADAGHDWSL